MHRIGRAAATAGILLLASLLSGCAGGGIIAMVDGYPITKAAVDDKLEAGPQAVTIVRQLVLNHLIDRYAATHGIAISESAIARREAEIRGTSTDEQWARYLQTLGMTEQEVRAALAQRMIIDTALADRISISDAQVDAYFAKNHGTFDQVAQVRVRHILVADLATAEKIERLLASGSAFADLAHTYSIDPGTKDKGGELGTIQRGQTLPPFEKIAFTQAIGIISPPVKTAFGYHIIQVEERQPGQRASLAGARDRIVDLLRQQQEAPLIEPWLSGLQSKAHITVRDPRFQEAFPTPSDSKGHTHE